MTYQSKQEEATLITHLVVVLIQRDDAAHWLIAPRGTLLLLHGPKA